MIEAMLKYYELAHRALKMGAAVEEIASVPSRDELAKLKFEKTFDQLYPGVMKAMERDFEKLMGGKGKGGSDEGVME